MNLRTALRSSIVAFLPLLIIPDISLATNGTLLIGFGAKSRAMGGAAVAHAQDSLVAAVNPAGIADVGTRADIGAMLFSPRRSAWVPGFSGRDNVQSGSNLFVMPNMGGVYKFNRKMSVGFAAVAFGGGNTRYNENFFDFAGDPPPTLGANLAQAVMSPSVSYKLTKQHTLGASLLLGIQQFRAYGMTAFGDAGFSSDPDSLSNRGNDYSVGAGVRVGWLSSFFKGRLSLGATASSRVRMTKLDKYKGLLAQNGRLDLPAIYSAGIAVKPVKKLTITGDLQYIDYSNIKALRNRGPKQFLPLPPDDQLLGASQGFGFGWQNMWVYKGGAKYDLNDKWILRAGYNYADTPISDIELLSNTIAPATVKHHATLGVTYNSSKNSEWSFAGMWAFKAQQVGFDSFSNDNIRISMYQYALEASYGFHF